MDKANRVLIGAFIILIIGFLVSYNGNMITGSFSKDVTGGAVTLPGDVSLPAITCEAWYTGLGVNYPETLPDTSWTPSTDDCIKAIDNDDSTRFGGYIGGWHKIKLSFSKQTNKIRLISKGGDNFHNVIIMPGGGSKIWVDNGDFVYDKIQDLGVSTDSVEIMWRGHLYNKYPTYVRDILVSSGVCEDTDVVSDIPNGFNSYLRGTVTDVWGNTYTDKCRPEISYKSMLEYYCENNEKKEGGTSCVNNCRDGKCICKLNNECPSGYECDANGDCVLTTCEDYTTKVGCIAENSGSETKCVWTPPGTISNSDGGGCCAGTGAEKQKWNPNLYPGQPNPGGCQGTASGDICNFASFEKFNPLSVKEIMFGKTGCTEHSACSTPWTHYCADIGSMIYGYWFPINTY